MLRVHVNNEDYITQGIRLFIDYEHSTTFQAFCYTPEGLSYAIHKVLESDKPTLLLGGGGYNFTNVAKTWTKITGLLSTEISYRLTTIFLYTLFQFDNN